MDQTTATAHGGLGNFGIFPEELLLSIISSLAIKDAVQTSVLSKSWKLGIRLSSSGFNCRFLLVTLVIRSNLFHDEGSPAQGLGIYFLAL